MGVKLDLINSMAVAVTAGIITEDQAVEIYEEMDKTAKTFTETPDRVDTITRHIESICKKLDKKGY